ncbi:DUF6507 family protein [Paenarthrobacter sp. NPDC089989]|uniref:DUF6507 family protein n=1 Tax=unclassified Paenarthrobacter TaxID=2634190 RepID=UPI003814CBF1
MTLSWDIDPAGTQAVLRKTAADIDEQNKMAANLGTALDNAGTLVGRGLVAKALSDYAEMSLIPHLKSIAAHSDRIIEGTGQALVAYVRADALMAQQSQASAMAVDAVTSDDGPVTDVGPTVWLERYPERD